MPGETKIFKNTNGWYDVDNPGVYHATRALCRDARKGNLPSKVTSLPRTTSAISCGTFTTVQAPAGPGLSAFQGLQHRLFVRLTAQQGVTTDEAKDVILNNGYNAAASYGHMREAGANHSEALFVIGIGAPDLSVAYGIARAAGYNHTGALEKAMREIQDAQDDNRND